MLLLICIGKEKPVFNLNQLLSKIAIERNSFRLITDSVTLLTGIMMKRLAVILLASVLVLETAFPQVDLAELSSLPEVWTHFKRHRLESPRITFLDFLSLHYGNPDHLN